MLEPHQIDKLTGGVMTEITIHGKRLKLLKGNIALLDVDAIVNAANKSLILGGGVAGAIRSLAGPSVQQECRAIGPINVGDAVMTGAGNLKARYVIHAAGPVFGEGREDEKLRRATRNSLALAERNRLHSMAFPAVSTGIFRFPLKRCSEIMLETAWTFMRDHAFPEEVIFCLYDAEAFAAFSDTLQRLSSALGK